MAVTGYTMEPLPVADLMAVAEDVVYRAPGKNDLEIRKSICDAAREFLRRTGVWKESRPCVHVQDGWYGFRHGYVHATVIRVDAFQEGVCLQRMEGEPDGVAPIPCGIPMPRIGNLHAPSIGHFVEQGGYVLVSAPGRLPAGLVPTPYQPEDCTISPLCVGSNHGSEGMAVFTLNIAFGGEQMPNDLIQRYGSHIADGAAHLLLAGPTPIRTTYGDRFNNACDTLAMRMSNGGPTAGLNARIFEGMEEV